MIKYYTVGGAIRDEILGIKNKDIDFAVEAPSYEAMRDDILSKGMIIFQERPEYFSIRGRHPDFGGVDFTLCRKEGFYSDNRHPDDVTPGTIYDDLARRDFTVNAIARDEDGKYIDPHGGVKDITRNLLKCVGNPIDRFTEDPLRLIRAIRFHIVRGFIFDRDLGTCLIDPKMIEGLKKIPLERIYEELRKCFEHNSYETIQFLHSYASLEYTIFEEMGLKLLPRVP